MLTWMELGEWRRVVEGGWSSVGALRVISVGLPGQLQAWRGLAGASGDAIRICRVWSPQTG